MFRHADVGEVSDLVAGPDGVVLTTRAVRSSGSMLVVQSVDSATGALQWTTDIGVPEVSGVLGPYLDPGNHLVYLSPPRPTVGHYAAWSLDARPAHRRRA